MELSSKRTRRPPDEMFPKTHEGKPLYQEEAPVQRGGPLNENRQILSDISLEKQLLADKIDRRESTGEEMERFIQVYHEIIKREQIDANANRLRDLLNQPRDPSVDLQIEALKETLRAQLREVEEFARAAK